MRPSFEVLLKDTKTIAHLDLKSLEEQFQFTYLDKLDLLHPEEHEKIRFEGIHHQNENKISMDRIKHGKQFQAEISQGKTAKVSLRWVSDEVGYGLFAEEDLGENSYVGEYTGLIRKNDEHGSFNHYLFSYPVLDSIGRNYVIDARDKGNLLRFANHSFQPNSKGTYAYFSGFYHLIVITLKNVLKGEQITYNYGKKYWYLRGEPATL